MRKVTLVFCLFAVLLLSFSSVFAGRYYIPEVARWATPDPALQKLPPQELLKLHNGKLLSTSPYTYSFDNPLRYVDPDGNTPWDIVDFGIAALSVKEFIANPSLKTGFYAGLDVLAAAAPVVPAPGYLRHGAKLLDKLDDITDIGAKLNRVRELGKAGESIVKSAFKLSDDVAQLTIPSLTGTKNFRKADFLTATTLFEVKNIKGLSNTSQLKDLLKFAEQGGKEFVLVVRKETQLSKPLQELVDKGEITLKFLEDLK